MKKLRMLSFLAFGEAELVKYPSFAAWHVRSISNLEMLALSFGMKGLTNLHMHVKAQKAWKIKKRGFIQLECW